jgi:hypothetical protein
MQSRPLHGGRGLKHVNRAPSATISRRPPPRGGACNMMVPRGEVRLPGILYTALSVGAGAQGSLSQTADKVSSQTLVFPRELDLFCRHAEKA